MGRWDGINRRKFPRVSYPCLVVIRNAVADNEVILSHTENVAVGGVGLVIKQEVKLFSDVDIELDLLDLGSHIKCKGKVVWCIKREATEKAKPNFFDVGVEFVDLSEDEQSRILAVVHRLAENSQE